MQLIESHSEPMPKAAITARKKFASDIALLDDPAFVSRMGAVLWQSALFACNPKNAFHWQKTACRLEAARRGKPELYAKVLAEAGKSRASND